MNNQFIIYRVLNSFTDEIYIGATTKSIEERRRCHLQKAFKSNSDGYFHQAIRTYGVDAFIWTEIDSSANSIDELAIKESEYISLYDSLDNGYNSDVGGGFKKTVYQYNLQSGELINAYQDLNDAANAVNADRKSICNVCLNINKTCKGYFWSYTNKFQPDLDKRKKKVNQYSLDGELINTFNSASDASRNCAISKVCITRCCRGERTQTGGFQWKYS